MNFNQLIVFSVVVSFYFSTDLFVGFCLEHILNFITKVNNEIDWKGY